MKKLPPRFNPSQSNIFSEERAERSENISYNDAFTLKVTGYYDNAWRGCSLYYQPSDILMHSRDKIIYYNSVGNDLKAIVRSICIL
jgi:hypothetical protein